LSFLAEKLLTGAQICKADRITRRLKKARKNLWDLPGLEKMDGSVKAIYIYCSPLSPCSFASDVKVPRKPAEKPTGELLNRGAQECKVIGSGVNWDAGVPEFSRMAGMAVRNQKACANFRVLEAARA